MEAEDLRTLVLQNIFADIYRKANPSGKEPYHEAPDGLTAAGMLCGVIYLLKDKNFQDLMFAVSNREDLCCYPWLINQ
jgi:hypothetical protein